MAQINVFPAATGEESTEILQLLKEVTGAAQADADRDRQAMERLKYLSIPAGQRDATTTSSRGSSARSMASVQSQRTAASAQTGARSEGTGTGPRTQRSDALTERDSVPHIGPSMRAPFQVIKKMPSFVSFASLQEVKRAQQEQQATKKSVMRELLCVLCHSVAVPGSVSGGDEILTRTEVCIVGGNDGKCRIYSIATQRLWAELCGLGGGTALMLDFLHPTEPQARI